MNREYFVFNPLERKKKLSHTLMQETDSHWKWMVIYTVMRPASFISFSSMHLDVWKKVEKKIQGDDDAILQNIWNLLKVLM